MEQKSVESMNINKGNQSHKKKLDGSKQKQNTKKRKINELKA